MMTDRNVEARNEAVEGPHEGNGDGNWEAAVRRYRPYLLRVATSYRIGDEAHDAVQNTFLRLLVHGDAIRKPDSLQWWLTTVLKRECLAVLARRRRDRPTESHVIDALLPPADEVEIDANVLSAENGSYVRRALSTLPPRQRDLLLTLSESNSSAYRSVSERMAMPLGSIGPTRQRALNGMRQALARAGYDAAA
jgi:RNA polymerase sigma factor (sigma-70 family)